ncbi:MAG: hypothetical protein ACOYMA_03000 [Bacteroidia bacterium]
MKKIVILSLSLIGLTTLTMMSFKDAPVKSKTLNENVKSSIGGGGQMTVYFGYNEACLPGFGFCLIKPWEPVGTDGKAVPVTITNNENGTVTFDLVEKNLDDKNEQFYKNLNVFVLNQNYQLNNAEVCETIHVNVGTVIQAGSYNITRSNGNMSINFKIN